MIWINGALAVARNLKKYEQQPHELTGFDGYFGDETADISGTEQMSLGDRYSSVLEPVSLMLQSVQLNTVAAQQHITGHINNLMRKTKLDHAEEDFDSLYTIFIFLRTSFGRFGTPGNPRTLETLN
ncbi:hypothetical protein BgiMline_014998 [Biomphalaria glabrata]|nr:hypothetical protein BgiMline_022117 [Biomphalaria glabrata]